MTYPTPSPTPSPTAVAARFDRLDALRGVAIVWMALFHFCFDLNHFRFIRQNFYTDPFWTRQRFAIVTLFMLCAGAGQAVALAQGQGWARFWRRWTQVAGCALLVSLGSWLMFPNSWISFGVLHAFALLLVLVRLAAPLGRWLWPLGLAAWLLPVFVQNPFFDTRWTNWVGLVTRLPVTEDYAPLLPWFGALAWGCAAAQWLLVHRRAWLTGPLPGEPGLPGVSMLATLGRWSLSFYMVHQPVLIGLLMAVAALR